jgi:FolB domain-containing protein
MDRILICDLRARCILGVNEDERGEKQDVTINLILFTSLLKAGKSDRMEDTVDYRAIKKRVLAMAEASHYYLAEALAQAVADVCLSEPRVAAVRVQVEKPSALRFARSVGVRIMRWREDGV